MRKMKRLEKSIIVFVISVIIASVFAGCGNSIKSSSNSAQVKKPEQINIGYLNGLSSTTLVLASKKGFVKEEFDKDGVKVNEIWITSGGGPAIVNAMESNSINVGGMADQPAIQALANGGTEKVVGVFSQSDKYVQLIVPKNSPAKSIKDLKGKKIAVGYGTIGHRVLFSMLKAAGMKPEDVEILNSGDGNILTSFASGYADASVQTEPNASKLELDGEIKIIGDTQGVKTNYTVLVSTGEFLKAYPEQVKTFLRAVKRSIDYINDPANHNEVVKILAEACEVKPAVVEKALTKFDFEAGISDEAMSSFQESADGMYAMQIIRKPVKAADLVDKSFVEALGYQKKR